MPSSPFHIRAGHGLERAGTGIDPPDMQAVRSEAVNTIAGFMRDAALSGDAVPGQAFEAADARGTHLLTVPLDGTLRRERSS